MERRIALERMEILFHEAEQEARHDRWARARRYVDLARRIGMRYNVRVPARFKRRFGTGGRRGRRHKTLRGRRATKL